MELSELQLDEASERALAAAGLSDIFEDEDSFLASGSHCEHNNRGVLEEDTAEALSEMGIDDLHQKLRPNHDIKHERFWHRQVAFMVAKGMSQTEIANELGKSNAWISQVVRQPWFSKLVLKELHSSGRTAVDEIFKNAAAASALKLIEIRDNPKTPIGVALNAADKLLDRYMGKAPQTLRHEDGGQVEDPVKEAEKLRQEIEALNNR